MIDSQEVSFSWGPLNPLKFDFEDLEYLIMPPQRIYCAFLKIEVRQNLIWLLRADQGLTGGRAFLHAYSKGN